MGIFSSKINNIVCTLLTIQPTFIFIDSSDNDQPLMVIKKKNDEAKSLISNAITGIQEESCNYSFEPNSLGSMSSSNYISILKCIFIYPV